MSKPIIEYKRGKKIVVGYRDESGKITRADAKPKEPVEKAKPKEKKEKVVDGPQS
jgi:hypothetical protein